MSSIFSAQDYSSVLGEVKAKKQAKQSGVNFSNILLKTTANKVHELIQKSHSINSSLQNTVLQNSSLKNSSLQNNIFALKFDKNLKAVDVFHGYSVDSNGFMGEDFNLKASLPKDFKIHSSSLQELEHFLENNSIAKTYKSELGIDKYYENIDYAHVFETYYRLFEDFASQALATKDFFTKEDIFSLPKAYSGEGGVFRARVNTDGKIINYGKNMPDAVDRSDEKIAHFYTQEDLNQLQAFKKQLVGSGLGIKIIELNINEESLRTDLQDEYKEIFFPSQESLKFKSAFNPNMSVYENEKGISKQALFMAFMKNDLTSNPAIPDGANTIINPLAFAKMKFDLEQNRGTVFADLSQVLNQELDYKALLKLRFEKDLLKQDFIEKKITDLSQFENYFANLQKQILNPLKNFYQNSSIEKTVSNA